MAAYFLRKSAARGTRDRRRTRATTTPIARRADLPPARRSLDLRTKSDVRLKGGMVGPPPGTRLGLPAVVGRAGGRTRDGRTESAASAAE
jgi:hypothetical protein